MNLHKHDIIYVLVFLFLTFSLNLGVNNHDIRVVRSGVDAVSSDAVGLKLYAEVQNNGTEDLDVEFSPIKCCLETGERQDCDALDIVVGCTQNIPAGKTKTMHLVVPLISPVDRRGYCTTLINYKTTNKNRRAKKNLRIKFNTASHKSYFRDLFVTTKSCNIDEDPHNDCKPVDCETYYNGKRPYYDAKIKRCTDVPACVPGKDHEDFAGIIYDPVTNKCKDSAVKEDDINYVKEQTRDRQRKPKGIVIIKKRKPLVKSVKSEGETPHKKVLLEKQKTHEAKSSWIAICNQSNNSMVPVLIAIILIQCVFLSSLVYFMVKNCCCLRKKKLISKYFNHRQDVSVTTPLIATSNIDTDTTEYQFVSESSNIDKKIKCYKACHDKVNKAKVSLSDDILSKCLHRRDWNTKPVRSEAVHEYKTIREELSDLYKVVDKSKLPEVHQTVNAKKSSDKVSIENEKSKLATEKKSTTKTVKSVKKQENSGSKVKKTERTELNDSDIVLSEKEIKCHSYNFIESNMNSRRASQETYNTAPFKSHSQQISNLQVMKSEKAIATSASTEKGAQASFSYDSIDDYLSERGMSYLVGEDMSKYSISSYSNDTKHSGLSGASSKTSKNNIVKNVLSLLTRKKKNSPSSYPRQKSRESLNLQLLHMSNASVYSSSNNDSGCMRTFKRLKDSRSTL